MSVDFDRVAKTIDLSPQQVRQTIDLLDGGNTVPFITRYRRDQTGGLDEEQIRKVEATVGKVLESSIFLFVVTDVSLAGHEYYTRRRRQGRIAAILCLINHMIPRL